MTFSRFASLTLLLLVGAALLLAGCDSNDPGESGETETDPFGTASVTVTGDVSDDFTGQGGFFTDTGSEDGLGVSFFEVAGGDTSFVSIVKRGAADLPQEQTYDVTGGEDTIDDGEFYAFYVMLNGGDGSQEIDFFADSGTVTFTSVEDDEIVGAFQFDAPRVSQESESVHVEGTFTAPRLQEEDIPEGLR